MNIIKASASQYRTMLAVIIISLEKTFYLVNSICWVRHLRVSPRRIAFATSDKTKIYPSLLLTISNCRAF
jgi:hypothetical protein